MADPLNKYNLLNDFLFYMGIYFYESGLILTALGEQNTTCKKIPI